MAKQKEKGYSWCPQCHKWVPEELMNYDVDEGKVIRVCTPCLEGTSDHNNYVVEEHHEDTKCLFCQSYDVVEQLKENTPKAQLKWNWFKCNSCGKTFRRLG